MKNIRVYVDGEFVEGIGFVYDGDHKIYIIESADEFIQAKEYGYTTLYSLDELDCAYTRSPRDIRFINNFNLSKTYAYQGDDVDIAVFREMESDKDEFTQQ